jgi:UDP-N-acetylmuramyl pentapeptide synthase
LRLTIPNPHQGEIGKDLLSRILKQAGISREEWENYNKEIGVNVTLVGAVAEQTETQL